MSNLFSSSSSSVRSINSKKPNSSGNINLGVSDIIGFDSILGGSSISSVSNTITYYVDSKYTGSITNGSILTPFTKIQDALNAIGTDDLATRGIYGEPSSVSDIHLYDTFSICVEHGIYNETITVPAYRFINMIAMNGPVVIGDSKFQNFISSSQNIHNVNINIYKNPNTTSTFYNQTVCFRTNLKTDQIPSYYTNVDVSSSQWIISGTINLVFIENSTYNPLELFFNQVRVDDSNNHTSFITSNLNSVTSIYPDQLNIRFVSCQGYKIDIYDSIKYPNVRILQIDKSCFNGDTICKTLGKISNSILNGSLTFRNMINNVDTYQNYCTGVYNTICSNSFMFICTGLMELYIDNATFYLSGQKINANSNINLHIDYRFTNYISNTATSAFQTLVSGTSNVSWSNIDHSWLVHNGTVYICKNSHENIDNFILSKNANNGICGLNASGKIDVNQIPAIALVSVNVVDTITQRNALIVQMGDVCIVINDGSNNGSYIYNGSSWYVLTTYIQPSHLSALTDVQLSTLTNGNFIIYDSTLAKWVNKASLTDSLFNLTNLANGSKVSFNLSNLTPNSIRTINIPDANTTLVGTDTTQTLTNKTLTDSTNNITARSLKSLTTTIDVSQAIAPSINQVLMATSSTNATWQTLPNSIARIQDCSDYLLNGTLTDNDALIYNSQTQKFKNSNVVTAIQSQMKDLTASSLKTKIQSNVTFNSSYSISYNDGVDGNFMFINSDDAYAYPPVSAICNKTINIGSDCVYSQNTDWNMSTTTYVRVNIVFDDIFQTSGVYLLNNGSSPTSTYIRIYGSNTESDYTSSNLTVSSTCVSLNTQQTYNGNALFIRTSDTNLYKYIIVLFLQGQAYNYLSVKIQCIRINGGFIPLTSPTDFTVSTGYNSGYPLITSKVTNTSNLSCNLQGLCVYECFRRVFPVIRDKSTINLYNSVMINNYIINYNDSGNLTLNNTISINSSGTISGAFWNGGIIPIVKGGTNSSSFTNNALLYSNNTSILSISSGLLNQHLVSNGSGNLPSWNSAWSGDIIQVSKGGTGNATFLAGQILVGNGSSSIVTLNSGSNNQFLMSQGTNLPQIFTNISQFPDSIYTSGKVNGSILRYNSTSARWETLGNVNVDDTGKLSCYTLGTTNIDISGHGDIRLNSTGAKWDIGVYAGNSDCLRFNPSYEDVVYFKRNGEIYSKALENHSNGILISSLGCIVNIETGSVNQILVSNGTDTLPTWQNNTNNTNITQYDRFSVFESITNHTLTTLEAIPWANNYFGYRMELDNITNRALYIQTCMPFCFDGGDFYAEILVNNGLNSDANGKTVTFSTWFNNLSHNGSLQCDSTTVNFNEFGWAKTIISFKNPNNYGVGISPHLFMLKIIRAYTNTWYFDTVWIAGINIVYKQNSFGITSYP